MPKLAVAFFWALLAFCLLRLVVGLMFRHAAVSSTMLNVTVGIFVANGALRLWRRSRLPRG